mmetsp:Transcript_28458/g.81834  ORF Transcript_28458/g.81834 Transcript_28458/m.81834 type:complete len:203 (+) Transcript_28458:303-911(+)
MLLDHDCGLAAQRASRPCKRLDVGELNRWSSRARQLLVIPVPVVEPRGGAVAVGVVCCGRSRQLEERVGVEALLSHQPVDLVGLRQAHEAHVRCDPRLQAATPEAIQRVRNEEHRKRDGGVDQDLRCEPGGGIAEQLQGADDQLGAVHRIHREEYVEHKQHDIELDSLHDEAVREETRPCVEAPRIPPAEVDAWGLRSRERD